MRRSWEGRDRNNSCFSYVAIGAMLRGYMKVGGPSRRKLPPRGALRSAKRELALSGRENRARPPPRKAGYRNFLSLKNHFQKLRKRKTLIGPGSGERGVYGFPRSRSEEGGRGGAYRKRVAGVKIKRFALEGTLGSPFKGEAKPREPTPAPRRPRFPWPISPRLRLEGLNPRFQYLTPPRR